jgi:predicted ATPase
VTVTGAGGSGKTRLALQVAAELVGEFDDGVFFVPLALLRDAELVLPTVAQSIGLRESHELRGKTTLLLLDNLEQLLDAAPDVADLLTTSPRLKLLATSRAPLRIDGEQEYALEPFTEEEAVEFFMDRARAVRSGVSANGAVTEICRRLDRLPLALELAAARVKLLDPPVLLERLDRRLPLLTSGRRDAPERQRTLRSTIEWSHDLLDKGQKQLFGELAVFVGSFLLEVAEEVCGAELEELAALVDLNLLKALGDGRFLMLETIREYALERLEQLPERGDLQRRHAETFVALAEAAGGEQFFEGSQALAFERVARENDNFRAAIEWSVESGRADLALRFAEALWFFWQARGHVREVGPWMEAALAEADPDLPQRLWGVLVLSGAALFEGDLERGRELKEEALAGFERRGEVRWTAALLADLGAIAIEQGEYDRARELLEQSLVLRSQPEARIGLGRTLAGIGELALAENDLERAESFFRQACAHAAEEAPGSTPAAWFAEGLAESLRRQGKVEDAGRIYREALVIYRNVGAQEGIAGCLGGLAALAASQGDGQRAGRLVGAAESLRNEWHAEPGLLERTPREVPETAKAEGAAMTLDEAVEYALKDSD